jgi:hypothetical protein
LGGAGTDAGAWPAAGCGGGARARTTSRAARSGRDSAAGARFKWIFLKIFKQNWTK